MNIMEVVIQDFWGKNKFVLEVQPQWTFENVKAKMQEQKGIPAYMCDLYHKDTLLENENTVSGFALESGSEVLFSLSFEKFQAKEQVLLSEKAEEKREDENEAGKDKKEGEEKDKAEKAQKDETGPSHSGDPAMVSSVIFNTSPLMLLCDQLWLKSFCLFFQIMRHFS